MNDVKAVRKVLSLASFFITAHHNSSANRKIERSKISALIVVVGDASASLDGSDAVDVRPRASQEQHVACFIAAARSLSLITGVYLALR